jgi:ADP-ribose pyrophosphatase
VRRASPKCIGSDSVLANRWITVRRNLYRLDGGVEAIDYYVTDTADIALVVPITQRGRFLMVEQWKLPIGERSVEFPAGAIDRGLPLANAKRELLEETGYSGGRWRKLGLAYPDTGRSRNRVHIFTAHGVARIREPAPDPVERACGLRVVEIGRRRLRELIAQGGVTSAGTLAALALFQAR